MADGQLGTIVSWRVPNQVALDVLRTALRDAGLDETLAGDMRPQNALRRALGEMKAGRVIRKLRRDGDELYFQLTKEHLDSQEITYNKEAEVHLNCDTGAVNGDDYEITAEARRLLAAHLDKRLTSDLTRLVQRVFDARRADLIPIREAGGAYFVPDMHTDLVEKVRTLLTEIKGKLRSFSVRLGSEDTKESVADSMSEYLISEIEDLEERCKEITAESRSDVVSRRLEEFGDKRKKLELYRGLLMGYADAIQEKFDSTERAILMKLTKQCEPSGDGEHVAQTHSEPMPLFDME